MPPLPAPIIQIEFCEKCLRPDFAEPGAGSFWGPWFYCTEHNNELNETYELYCELEEATPSRRRPSLFDDGTGDGEFLF